MRKRMKMMVAAIVCAATMVMVGCGNNGQSQMTASDAPAAEAHDPKTKFIGEWKLTYIESDGMTIAGDLAGLAKLTGEDLSIVTTLKDDGTGAMKIGPDGDDVAWELVDDDNISITLKTEDGDSLVPGTFDDGELRLDMSGAMSDAAEAAGEGDIAENVTEGTMVFTVDGKSDRIKVVDPAEGTAITSEDALVGDWKLGGMGIFGLYMYGDADGIDSMFGEESASISFKKDGVCSFFGSDAKYEVTKDGAALVQDGSDAKVAIKASGDDIIIDMSALFGDVPGNDTPLFLVYSK